MKRRTKPSVCEFCGVAIHRRRDTEAHMKTYHPEPNGVEDVENICTPIDPVVEDNEAVANDNEPASQKAIDALAAIEKEFREFKTRQLNLQLAEIEEQEALLKQDLHPDQTEPLAVIRNFVNDRLQPEQAQYKYSVQNAKFKLESGTALLHSQYFQEVRAVREKKIEDGHDELHNIRKLDALEKRNEKEAEENP